MMSGGLRTFALCAALSCVALDAQAQSSPGYGNVAWEELAGASVAQLREQLPLLQERGLSLTLHWKAEQLDDAERWALVKDAVARGVRVIPWLTLPDEQGYFPNATNYEAWIGAARELLKVWRERGLPPTALSLDLEPPKAELYEFQRLTASGDVLGVVRFLSERVDRPQYEAAGRAFHSFVADAHTLGFSVYVTTLLPLLDDYADGDDFLRQAFHCPLDAAEWDEISFQIHRTIYAQSYPVNAYLVYDYGRSAQRRFGARAGIGIGLTHAGIASDPDIVYASGDALRADTEAALAAGFPRERIGVYSLLGMYTRAPLEQWLQPAGARVPARDLGTEMLHASVQLIDALGH